MRIRIDAWTVREVEPGVWQCLNGANEDAETFTNAMDAWDRADELNAP